MTCVMENRGGCWGKLDLHHIVPKGVLRNRLGREEGTQAARDDRNLVGICRWHHQQITTRGIQNTRLRVDEAPDKVWEFASDYGPKIVAALDEQLEDAGDQSESAREYADSRGDAPKLDSEVSDSPSTTWEAQDELHERIGTPHIGYRMRGH